MKNNILTTILDVYCAFTFQATRDEQHFEHFFLCFFSFTFQATRDEEQHFDHYS